MSSKCRPVVGFGEFGGEFHTLALTAGEGGGGLTEFDIAETHILDGLDLSEDVGHVLEKFHGLVDGHVEHIGDRLALIAHFEGLTVVTLAMTGLGSSRWSCSHCRRRSRSARPSR